MVEYELTYMISFDEEENEFKSLLDEIDGVDEEDFELPPKNIYLSLIYAQKKD